MELFYLETLQTTLVTTKIKFYFLYKYIFIDKISASLISNVTIFVPFLSAPIFEKLSHQNQITQTHKVFTMQRLCLSCSHISLILPPTM
jgi:hypothetical protein